MSRNDPVLFSGLRVAGVASFNQPPTAGLVAKIGRTAGPFLRWCIWDTGRSDRSASKCGPMWKVERLGTLPGLGVWAGLWVFMKLVRSPLLDWGMVGTAPAQVPADHPLYLGSPAKHVVRTVALHAPCTGLIGYGNAGWTASSPTPDGADHPRADVGWSTGLPEFSIAGGGIVPVGRSRSKHRYGVGSASITSVESQTGGMQRDAPGISPAASRERLPDGRFRRVDRCGHSDNHENAPAHGSGEAGASPIAASGRPRPHCDLDRLGARRDGDLRAGRDQPFSLGLVRLVTYARPSGVRTTTRKDSPDSSVAYTSWNSPTSAIDRPLTRVMIMFG